MVKKDEKKVKGGMARAKSLTPEERKQIARKAAQSRWDADIPIAEFEGDLNIGDKTISAVVLPNGKRLLTQATFLRALGRSRSPKAGTGVLSTVDGIPFFLQANQLKPFISNKLMESTTPIFYRTSTGKKGVGYDAELLPMVCEVYLQLRDSTLQNAGKIPATFAHIIVACDILMRGLATVGIVALVDEATGYQEIRDRKALQVILDKYITDEMAKWTKTFPDEFYKELFRLKGLDYPTPGGKKPQYVGHWTNNVIYSRLAPGVREALKKKNPRESKSGNRKHKDHQFLTRDYGHPELQELLSNVIFMMRACSSFEQFEIMLNKTRQKYGKTIEMDV